VQISVRRIDKTAILELTGSIDLSSSPAVRKILLNELRESRTPRVILKLLLFGLTPVVREVLQLSRLLKIFEIYENEQQALSA